MGMCREPWIAGGDKIASGSWGATGRRKKKDQGKPGSILRILRYTGGHGSLCGMLSAGRQGGPEMKFHFENHWPHGHIILLGMDRGRVKYRRYLEVTLLNFGLQISWSVK